MATTVTKEASLQGTYGAAQGASIGLMGGMAAGMATGAAAGSVVPVVGTAIGAIVGGLIGTVGGVFSGKKKSKAKKYSRLAAQIQQQRENNRDYENFLQLVRKQRIARASTLAQAVAANLPTNTSAVGGAISGQQSQTAHSINYLAEDKRLQELYLSYLKRANVNTSVAQDINAATNAAVIAGSYLASTFGTPKVTGMFNGSSSSTPALPEVTPSSTAPTAFGVYNLYN